MLALFFTAVLSFAGIANTSPTAKRQDQDGYTMRACCGAVNANGGNFYIHKPTQAGCDTGASCAHYSNTTTIQVFDSTHRAGLWGDVPGPQFVYVANNGALAFTLPHESAGPLPSGSSVTGFAVAIVDGHEALTFSGLPNSGWAACGPEGQIFALVKDNGCEQAWPATIALSSVNEPGSFQYD